MAEYCSTEKDAEEKIKQCSTEPVFYAKILHAGQEKWMFDFRERDYTGAAFKILEVLTPKIRQIRGGGHPSNG